MIVDYSDFISSRPCGKLLHANRINDATYVADFRFSPSHESQRLSHTGPDPLTLANDIMCFLDSLVPSFSVDWIELRLFVLHESMEELVANYPLFLSWVELAQGNVSRLYEHICDIVSKCHRMKDPGTSRFRARLGPRRGIASYTGKEKILILQPTEPVAPVSTLDPEFFVQNIIANFVS